MNDPSMDPMDFLKRLWGNIGTPLPGMSIPTLDTGELDKRITDLKAVEGWLKMNLNMLQMSIQALEVQRATLSALQVMSQNAPSPSATSETNPFVNAALWPWNLMPTGQAKSSPTENSEPTSGKPEQAR